MKILMKTSPDNEYQQDNCNYAIVDITPELARLVVDRVAQFRAMLADDRNLAEIRYHSYDAEYVTLDYDDDTQESMLNSLEDGVEYVEVPDSLDIDDMRQRTECDLMLVRGSGIEFITLPKHYDHFVRCGELPVSLFEDVLDPAHAVR